MLIRMAMLPFPWEVLLNLKKKKASAFHHEVQYHIYPYHLMEVPFYFKSAKRFSHKLYWILYHMVFFYIYWYFFFDLLSYINIFVYGKHFLMLTHPYIPKIKPVCSLSILVYTIPNVISCWIYVIITLD